MRRFSLIVLLLVAAAVSSFAAQTATVMTSDPVTFTKGASRATRPVQPDEVFNVVAVNGDQVTIADVDGYQATLGRSVLKMVEVQPPAPPPAPTTNTAPAVAAAPAVATTNAAPAVTSSSQTPVVPALSPADADMIKKLDDIFQVPLFAASSLWTEDAATVAGRLQWPQESNTTFDASYRRYALGADGVSVLGARAYSLALYARNGHPTSVSIVFANKGDFGEIEAISAKNMEHIPVPPDEMQKAVTDLNAAVKADADTINAQLTALLGDPETHVFGISADSRETVHRWDWNGHAILFTYPRNEYAAIKIVPVEVADHLGDVENMDRDDLKDALAKRVLKRDNGDVVLQDIPMVDQGPKGYCGPATWERYLRYVDVPADMYVLALIGNTTIGGGTNFDALYKVADSYAESYHRRVEFADRTLDVPGVAKYIDQGLPLMWACFYVKGVEKSINDHTADRKKVTDWDAYKAKLQAEDKSLTPVNLGDPDLAGHMRMIIGYNAQTNELAISDSWGKDYAERWITVAEAQNISQGELVYVQW